MKRNLLLNWFLALGFVTATVAAQETNELEQLKQQLRLATQNFEKMVQEQQQVIHRLTQRLDELEKRTPVPAPPTTPASLTEKAQAPPTAAARNWQSSDPFRFGGADKYLDIGLVGTFAAGASTAADIAGGTQSGGHDPAQRGFNVQGLELNLSGAVDPYFRGNANLVYSLGADGESFFELEEGWLETMSLPGNLQLRAGQIYTGFGRHNPTHLHTWGFVDAPLVNGRFLGEDGLRNPGARLSWLLPVPFFAELSLGVQNSHGGTASGFRSGGHHHHGGEEEEGLPFAYRHADNDRGFKSLGDLLFSPRCAMSFELTDAQTLLAGISAALGPNHSGGEGDTQTRIFGADLTWKWKSPRHHGGFPFVTVQTEAMLRQYEAGAFDWDEEGATPGALDPAEEVRDLNTGLAAFLPRETLTDYGLYSQVLYGFRKGWVAGLRGDFVGGDRARYERMALDFNGLALGRDPHRAQRWRLSPNLTWYPSEYSKVRLQYNLDQRQGLGMDHSVWLQLEFLLGAHAAHKF